MRSTRVGVLAIACVLAAAAAGCTADADLPSEVATSTTQTVEPSPSSTTPASLSGTLVRDERDHWWLELGEDDAATYGAPRLSVHVAGEFAVSCRDDGAEVDLTDLPSGVAATVEFVAVLDSDPISLPPTAITADC